MEVVSHWHTQRRARGLGQGGWRSRTHAERDSQACAFVYVCERDPFLSLHQRLPVGSGSSSGKEGGRVKRTGLCSGACVHTHICRPLGRRVTHKHPHSPLSQRRTSHTECSSYHGSLMPSHTHTYVQTHRADFKHFLTHSSQLLAMQATLRGRILARYCRLPWSTT